MHLTVPLASQTIFLMTQKPANAFMTWIQKETVLLAMLLSSLMIRVVLIAVVTARIQSAPNWLASVWDVFLLSYLRVMEVVVARLATISTAKVRHAFWKQSAQQASIWITLVTLVFHAE
jgi:hypothetical protein